MLAAAVVVDACCVILGRNVLENPVSHGQSLAAVLAAALSRVSGYPGPVLEMPLEYTADSEAMLVLAEEHVDWIRTICPQAPAQVLVRAASDLSAAGFETAFASYGSLLQLLAVQSDYS
jgi:hypothetical protein